MSEKLKQCPFCKGEFAFDFEAKNFRCGTCGATVPPDPYARTVNTRPIEDELTARIAELEEQNDRLQDAWFKDETICPDGSLKPKVSTLLSRIAELTECIGSQMADVYTLKARIAELEEDKRSLRDSNLWLKQNYEDLERDYGVMHEKMCARIDKLKGAIEIMEDQQREAKNILIDKNLHIDSLYEEGYKLQQRIAELERLVETYTTSNGLRNRVLQDIVEKQTKRIAELERDFDMLFRSSANKQPRKNTQTLTFEYGMESEE